MRHGRDVGADHVELVDAPQPALFVRHEDLALALDRSHEQHVGGVGVQLEVVGHPLPQHARRERSESLAELDLQVHLGLHARAPGVAKNAARAERARTELHAAVEPSDHLLLRQKFGHAPQQTRSIEPLIPSSLALEKRLDLLGGELGPEVGPLHCVLAGRHGPGPLLVAVPDELRDTQRPARVAGGRLDPEPLERPLAQDAPIRHAIQRHPAREAEILHSGIAVQRARHAQHDLLAHHLHRAREIHLALRQLRLRDARRPAEQLVERAVRHRQAREIVEVLLVERERAVLAHRDQVPVDRLHVLGLAVGRQTHHLVLARVHLEARVVRERGVQQPERIGPVQLFEQGDIVAASYAHGGGGPLPNAVHGENRGLFEGRRKKRTCRMRLVVLGVPDFPLVSSQCPADVPLHKELLLHPQRTGHAERSEALRGDTQVGFENALELEQRLVVEADVREVGGLDARRRETMGDGLTGKRGVSLLATEALFLRRGHDLAVGQQARRTVVIERGDAQDIAWSHEVPGCLCPSCQQGPCYRAPPVLRP